MNIKAGVSNFEYARYSFSGIDMKAILANGKTNVAFNINDNMMEIGSILDADISSNNIMAKMRTDIKRLDLHSLGLVAQPLKIAG